MSRTYSSQLPHKRLTEVCLVWSFDLDTGRLGPENSPTRIVRKTVDSGRLDAMVFWFDQDYVREAVTVSTGAQVCDSVIV